MFTGIIEEKGEVLDVVRLTDSARITLRGPRVTEEAAHGQSIAVNGVCLTVTDPSGAAGGTFTADVMAETLTRSTLGDLQPGHQVNLERAARLDSRLDGHLVQGHVDGVGTVIERLPGERWETVRISLPEPMAPFVVEKGSIAVDGISLTVVEVSGPEDPEPSFTVSLVPTTIDATTLGTAPVGSRVNLEVDVLAKYVARHLAFAGVDGRSAA